MWTAKQTWPEAKAKFNDKVSFGTCNKAREWLADAMEERLSDLTDRFMNDHFMRPGARAQLKGLMEDLEDAIEKLQDSIGVEPAADYRVTLGEVEYIITLHREQS